MKSVSELPNYKTGKYIMDENKTILLKMFVIDVLKYDTENIRSIIKLLNDQGCIGWRKAWYHDFTEEEVTKALFLNYQEKSVDILYHNQKANCLEDLQTDITNWDDLLKKELWFKLTNIGLDKWNDWAPPIID